MGIQFCTSNIYEWVWFHAEWIYEWGVFFQTPAEPPYPILIERDSASKLGNFFESFVFAFLFKSNLNPL